MAIGAGVDAFADTLAGSAIESEQAVCTYPLWYADTPPPPPYAPALQIEVTPDDTEIIFDGTRVGLAKELYGLVRVPVMAGPNVGSFPGAGFSVTETIMSSPWTTVPIKRELRPSASASHHP